MNTLSLSSRAGLLKPSPTLAITGRAKAMKAQGIDVLSFAAGEPDFNTPDPINRAAIQAIEAGFTKYTPSAGMPELKEAVCAKLARENDVHATPENIVVSCGAKHSVYNTMMILLEPGDEVILIAPYWMTYADQVALAGGRHVVVQTRAEDDFVPAIDAIAEAITPQSKAIMLNSPCNPTGAVFPPETIAGIANLAVRHGLWIVADEIYERLIYGERHQSPAALSNEVAAQTVTIGGCSKSYAMTGWRIGFACAPTPLAKAMSNFQDQVTSNPTSFAQKGAVAAYQLDPQAVEGMRAEFEARRDLIVRLLRNIPGVEVPNPKGAFYAFPDVSRFIGGAAADDVQLAEHLLETARIATVPGSVFEGPGHLRLSYAASRKDIEEGVGRLAEALDKLR